MDVDDIVILNNNIYANETTLSFSYTLIGIEGTRYENLKGSINIPVNTTGSEVTRTVLFENEYYNFEIEYVQSGTENKYATPFYIENATEDTGYIGFNNYSHQMLVSTNMNDWLLVDPYNDDIILNPNSRVYFKNPIDAGYFNDNNYSNAIFVDNCNGFNIGGNAMSLCYNNFTDKLEFTKSHALQNLFNGSEILINAERLLLPATKLTYYCYGYMFSGCSNLETAPVLPATKLEYQCYSYMFYDNNNISKIVCLAKDNADSYDLGELLYGLTNLENVTFVKYEGVDLSDYIPDGWTVKDFVPDTIIDIDIKADNVIGSRTYTYYEENLTVNGHIELGGISTGETLTEIRLTLGGISNAFQTNETDGIVEREVMITEPLLGNTYSTTISQYPSYNAIMFSHNGGTTIQPIYKYSRNISSLEYSFDGIEWHTLEGDYDMNNSDVYLYNQLSGDVIFLRGMNPNGISHSTGNGQLMFDIYTPTSVSGDIMKLINYNDTVTEIPCDSCFRNMFRDSYIVTAPDLTATTLNTFCYFKMFYQSALIKAPELPSMELNESCYYEMFYGCTSLVTAPELPATTLANSCYSRMFYECTNLAAAPELPATTLASNCYQYMFNGCTSLTTAPELPATTLVSNCYSSMFSYCTNLTAAPELPATSLASYCYHSMFNKCTSLTTAPELPATELVEYCYQSMFYGCTSLTTAPAILPATTLANYCYYCMFQGCTSLTTAPAILPATTLASSCYDSMFYGCTSLTAAPELPATTLASNCYQYMFYRCTNLNYIKVGATSWNTSYADGWVNGVSNTGTFVKPTDVVISTGVNGIPSGWTVENF